MSFGQNLLELVYRQICETCNLRVFSDLFLLLIGSGPKRSMPIAKLGSPSLVSSIFQRERKLHCSLTGRKLWSQVKKCSRHLIYPRACVNKDFVHSGSGQTRTLCYKVIFLFRDTQVLVICLGSFNITHIYLNCLLSCLKKL